MTDTKPLPANTYGAMPAGKVPAPEPTEQDSSKGSTTLIIGGIGVGKTHDLQTLIGSGIKPFIIATEPGIQAVLGHLPKGSYHLKYIAPGVISLADMLKNAKMLNSSTIKAIANLDDITKSKFQQYLDVIETCANFKCDITGESFGAVDEWNTDRALCLDTLSGFNRMCIDFVVGSKPVLAQIDWQVAQNINASFIRLLTNACRCHVIVNAHAEKELDELTGGARIMASSLGKKLAPLLPRDFDNVLLKEVSSEGKFSWSSVPGKADLKSRHLPRSDKLIPDFKQIIEAWKLKGGKILPTTLV